MRFPSSPSYPVCSRKTRRSGACTAPPCTTKALRWCDMSGPSSGAEVDVPPPISSAPDSTTCHQERCDTGSCTSMRARGKGPAPPYSSTPLNTNPLPAAWGAGCKRSCETESPGEASLVLVVQSSHGAQCTRHSESACAKGSPPCVATKVDVAKAKAAQDAKRSTARRQGPGARAGWGSRRRRGASPGQRCETQRRNLRALRRDHARGAVGTRSAARVSGACVASSRGGTTMCATGALAPWRAEEGRVAGVRGGPRAKVTA